MALERDMEKEIDEVERLIDSEHRINPLFSEGLERNQVGSQATAIHSPRSMDLEMTNLEPRGHSPKRHFPLCMWHRPTLTLVSLSQTSSPTPAAQLPTG